MSSYTEDSYENALIELFQNMGWVHVYGPDIERDFYSPLYDSILEESLHRINPKAAPAAINEALLKLFHFENDELKKKNALLWTTFRMALKFPILQTAKQKLTSSIWRITIT